MKNSLCSIWTKLQSMALATLVIALAPVAFAQDAGLDPAPTATPQIQNFSINPTNNYRPQEDGNMNISFRLSQSAYTSIYVLDTNNNLQATVLFSAQTIPNENYTFTYNGRRSNGDYLSPGNYVVQVIANNSFGSATQTRSFTVPSPVDPTPTCTANLSNLAYSTAQVSGEGNIFYPQANFTLARQARISVSVLRGNSVIANLTTNTLTNPGNQSRSWVTSSNDMAGPHSFRITSQEDGCEPEVRTINFSLTTSQIPGAECPAILSNVFADTGTMSGSNISQPRINLTLSRQSRVNVEVMSGNTIVRNLMMNRTLNGSNSEIWDARNNNGQTVSAGSYTFRVRALDLSNTNCQEETRTISFNLSQNQIPGGDNGNEFEPDLPSTRENLITNLRVEPNYIDPLSSNTSRNRTRVSFTLNDTARVLKVQLVSGNQVLAEILNTTNQNSGNYQYDFNGRNNQNQLIANGIYDIRVMAEDYSNLSDTDRACLAISTGNSNFRCSGSDYDGDDWPTTDDSIISNLQVFNEIFNPNRGERARIRFNANDNLDRLVVQVMDGNNVIRTLFNGTNISRGTYEYEWDGRDSDGRIVRDAVYQFRVMGDNGRDTDTDRAYTEVDTDGIIIGFPIGARCAGFRDVSIYSPFCKAVELMSRENIFEGYSDGTFRPYRSINRAEATKVIVLALGYNVNSSATFGRIFSDTISNAWYIPYLRVATENGIIHGYPDGTFRPSNTINRVELLKVFLEAHRVGLPTCQTAPYDDTPIQHDTMWYMPYACYAKNNGLMGGYGNLLNPAQAMTRGDVAELFYQFEIRGLYTGYNQSTSTSTNRNVYNYSGNNYTGSNQNIYTYSNNQNNYSYGYNTSFAPNTYGYQTNSGYYVWNNGRYEYVSY